MSGVVFHRGVSSRLASKWMTRDVIQDDKKFILLDVTNTSPPSLVFSGCVAPETGPKEGVRSFDG